MDLEKEIEAKEAELEALKAKRKTKDSVKEAVTVLRKKDDKPSGGDAKALAVATLRKQFG